MPAHQAEQGASRILFEIVADCRVRS